MSPIPISIYKPKAKEIDLDSLKSAVKDSDSLLIILNKQSETREIDIEAKELESAISDSIYRNISYSQKRKLTQNIHLWELTSQLF